jgi:hypothetical protein
MRKALSGWPALLLPEERGHHARARGERQREYQQDHRLSDQPSRHPFPGPSANVPAHYCSAHSQMTIIVYPDNVPHHPWRVSGARGSRPAEMS